MEEGSSEEGDRGGDLRFRQNDGAQPRDTRAEKKARTQKPVEKKGQEYKQRTKIFLEFLMAVRSTKYGHKEGWRTLHFSKEEGREIGEERPTDKSCLYSQAEKRYRGSGQPP